VAAFPNGGACLDFVMREPFNFPAARTWRDIPQPVKSRAMSAGGKRRLALRVARVVGAIGFGGALAWGAWFVIGATWENPRKMPAVTKTVPVRPPELSTDGVLDQTWLARTLALPQGASLLELDLAALRTKLLANGQVLSATLTRTFPDRLQVQISERSPVARLMAVAGGRQQQFLVARDGVVFAGADFDPAVLDSLPWLDGVTMVRQGSGYRPIMGMDTVAELLAKASLEADHLYRTWNVVSLARLESDAEIEVRTKNDATIVFSAAGDFFRQLARLDYTWDRLASLPPSRVRIDLSLGADVPVTAQPLEPAAMTTKSKTAIAEVAMPPAPVVRDRSNAFFVLPSPPPNKIKREL
jgi:hypothetical protein